MCITEFMKDIGIEDDGDDFTSTPDISEMSEAGDLPLENAPKPPIQPTVKQQDSDWDSTEPAVTPRSQKSILKTSKQVRLHFEKFHLY